MNPRILIAILAGGAVLLLLWILSLGSGEGPSDPVLRADGAQEKPAAPGAPSLDAPERAAESREESRVPAEGSAEIDVLADPQRARASRKAPVAGGPVRGRVLDVQGIPVAGASVLAGSLPSDGARGIRTESSSFLGESLNPAGNQPAQPIAQSGDQGRFEIQRPPDGTVLSARGESHVPVLSLAWWGSDPDYAEPVLVVARPAAVAGVVVDDSDRPLEGVSVAVRMPEGIKGSIGVILDRAEPLEYFARSGQDGRFEIADAPSVEGRRILAVREGSPFQVIEIAPGPETELRIVFVIAPEPENAVKGVVVDAEDRPVADASIRLVGQVARSGPDGRFLLDPKEVQPGNEIVAAKPGFLPARVPFEPPAKDLKLRLGPAAARIAGRVTDEAGKPMPGVEMRLLGLTQVGGVSLEDLATWEGPGPFTVGDTDAEGRFALGGLQPRAYVLGLLDRSSLRTMRTEPLPAGRTDLEIRFRGDAETVVVAGRVVDRGGSPVPHAEIRLLREIVREEGGFREGVDVFRTADEKGEFEFAGVARDVRAAHVGFPGDAGFEHPLEGRDLGHLVLVAYRRAHFQIDLGSADVQADSFAILDADARAIPIVQYEGSIARSNLRWQLEEGRAGPLTVLDAAETAVLYRGSEEVLRFPIRLVPGELSLVRP